MLTILCNAKLVLPDAVRDGYLIVKDGIIDSIGFTQALPVLPDAKIIDLQGRYLAPGFVELHSHGAGGADFMDGTLDAFLTACTTHLQHGTTTLLPTTLAATKEEILRSIDCFRKTKEQLAERGPYLHGLHMEGPYLNVNQCGAIDPNYIRDPAPEEYEYFLQYGKNAIARWTLAVELDGAKEFAQRLVQEGILPSIGHSNAEYIQVKEAYAAGVTHVTHLYSAMSTIVRKSGFRHSGVLESAFCIPDMTVELIADGCHIPLELLEYVYRVKGADKIALTCDSIRAAGQDVTESKIGSLENGQPVIIEEGVAKLPDRTAFAGSIATDDVLVRVMHRKVGIPLADAVRMMTLTPATIIGLEKSKGSLAPGKDADLVCFDDDISILGVMTAGKPQTGIFCE